MCLALLPPSAAQASGEHAASNGRCDWRTSHPSFERELRAARRGNLFAMFDVAVEYDHGEGVSRAPQKAAYWYLKAAKRGHPVAIMAMVRAYQKGEGVPRDLSAALHWELIAANSGDATAMAALVKAYRRGQGVEPNPAEADRWLRRLRVVLPYAPDPDAPDKVQQRYAEDDARRAVADAAAAAADAAEAASTNRPN